MPGSMVPTPSELKTARAVADLLLPGTATAPAATAVPDFDQRFTEACNAVAPEAQQLRLALARVSESPLDWDSLRTFAETEPELFDVLSAVVSGAYFMSSQALDALGYPHGSRRRPSPQQIADEIDTGILDAVLARPSMVRPVPGKEGVR
ncbi:hypothetical protein [Amycolatopsis jejuensis]|uniref:hypothetical protein n=1 Tax=Amycolatopsis jejuensis TaxID=330084 RepID=UPI000526E891|nr:hypothetical protein [Amycolatopsis jejuensis]